MATLQAAAAAAASVAASSPQHHLSSSLSSLSAATAISSSSLSSSSSLFLHGCMRPFRAAARAASSPTATAQTSSFSSSSPTSAAVSAVFSKRLLSARGVRQETFRPCSVKASSTGGMERGKEEQAEEETMWKFCTSSWNLLSDASKAALVAGFAALQLFSPLPGSSILGLPEANAVLLSPSTALPKNAEVALRRAVPVVNQELRTIQENLEEIFAYLRIPQRKPYGTMAANVEKSIKIATDNKDGILKNVPADKRADGEALFDRIVKGRGGLEGLLEAIKDKDADRVSIRLASSLETISNLALLEAPALPYFISQQYAELPRLTGRAVLELSVLKGDQSSFSIENGAASIPTGVLEVVLDGYSAPLTAGNFALLVSQRAYDGVAMKVASQAVLSEARDSSLGVEVPLEIMPSGEFQPFYRTPLEIQDGELPVLPMSVYGALAMAHSVQSDSLNHPSQFFFYLYNKNNSGLGGIAFEEGQFSVFGYVTKGRDILSQLKTGDVIQSIRIIEGKDRLVVPKL